MTRRLSSLTGYFEYSLLVSPDLRAMALNTNKATRNREHYANSDVHKLQVQYLAPVYL